MAEPDERDYVIASAYSLLIGETRRRELSAYFTPPVLSRAVLEASAPILDRYNDPDVLDPACGGGSFLTPVVRYLISKNVQRGSSSETACARVLKCVRGIEIDPGLASLSQTLLRDMLARETGFRVNGKLGVVRRADALRQCPGKTFDLIVGNPPFGKIGSKRVNVFLRDGEPGNMGRHTNLYALFLMRSLNWVKPGGGLVFVLPTSFVAGPYFASVRKQVLKQAEVARIELHEQRENLFLGAVQDMVNERFSAVCGTFSVSAKLLQRLALPDLAAVSKLRNGEMEHGLRTLFARVKNLLASDAAGNAQDAIDKTGNLRSGTAIDKDAGLKRRAIAWAEHVGRSDIR